MKSLRWGLVLSVIGGAVILSGCQGKWISRGEMDKYKSFERLNTDQATMISAKTMENERLASENASLRSQLVTTSELLDAQKRLVSEMEGKVAQGITAGTIDEGDIKVGTDRYGRTHLQMASDVLFDSGAATLKTRGEEILRQAAEMVRDQPNKLEICGFTDSDPIRHSGWKSNFDLSGARALTVLEALRKNGIDPERMHFSGYGEYSLILKDGKEDKKASRRAEIVLLTDEPATVETMAPAQHVVPK